MTIILIAQEVYGALKKDDVLNNADATNDDNAPLFKYKASLITNTEADETKREIKIAVPLQHLSNFLEIIRNAFN